MPYMGQGGLVPMAKMNGLRAAAFTAGLLKERQDLSRIDENHEITAEAVQHTGNSAG